MFHFFHRARTTCRYVTQASSNVTIHISGLYFQMWHDLYGASTARLGPPGGVLAGNQTTGLSGSGAESHNQGKHWHDYS